MKYPTKMLPTRLGVYTQKIVKPVFKARGLMEGKIITHWSQIVGEKFSRLAIPEKITFPQGKRSEGTLHLSATSSGALLIQYAQDLILEQVNIFFGYKALSKLWVTHGFVPPKQICSRESVVLLSEENQEWVDGHIGQVVDPGLKDCLEKLGKAVCR